MFNMCVCTMWRGARQRSSDEQILKFDKYFFMTSLQLYTYCSIICRIVDLYGNDYKNSFEMF